METEAYPGVNVMLMGPAGTGKTHAIGTLVDTGIEVFYLALENGLESLLGYYADNGKPVPQNLHWHVLKGPDAGFGELEATAKQINTMSFEMLTKLQDSNRGKYNQFIGLLSALNNFHDDRTKKTFGAVNTWGSDKALVIDGMTGLGRCALSLVVGGKPVRSMADWGIAQDQVEKVIQKLCDACPCHFVLLAHVERETDQVLGGTKIMLATLGKALAPKIPAMFSDVILSVRQGDKWTWDTANPMADTKTRNLPVSVNIPPTFATIITKWRARRDAGAAVSPSKTI